MPLSEILFAIFGSPGMMLVVLVVALLLFGKRLPELMRSLGRSVTEFKKGIEESQEEGADQKQIDESK